MSDRIVVTTVINGEDTEFLADSRDSLLDALRERIGLTGAKEGCNNGNCGACAVIMALDTKLDVAATADAFETRAAVMKALQGHVRGKATYVGLFRRPQ